MKGNKDPVKSRKLTDDERELVRELAAAGLASRQIMEKLNLYLYRVQECYITHNEDDISHPFLRNVVELNVRDLWDKGFSPTAIALKLRMPLDKVNEYLANGRRGAIGVEL